MNYTGLKRLFEVAPKIREILQNHSEAHVASKIQEMLTKEFKDFDVIMGDALRAYSQNGFTALPQPHDKRVCKVYRTHRLFDWELVNIVRKTELEPTNYQLIQLDTAVFLIQYLITGGFKRTTPIVDHTLVYDEFDEAKAFIKSLRT